MMNVKHPFEPIYDEDSEILVLGSFPSVTSRERAFYYAHPKNRFWKVMSAVFSQEVPQSVSEKKEFLLRNHIAVWDVINRCDIEGSSDSSIKNVVVNDLSKVLEQTKIRRIYANGKTAQKLYEKYLLNKTGFPIVLLPSSSPANAAYSLERLIAIWTTALGKTGTM